MQKEYFYAPDIRHGMNALGEPSVINKISTEDIKHLAIYIVENFEPVLREHVMTIGLGYIRALSEYSEENKDFPYSEIFEKLRSVDNSEFLHHNIMLTLFEKKFREEGINEKDMDSYNKYQEQYQKKLEFNRQYYGDLFKKGKMK